MTDKEGKPRVAGEEWVVRKIGTYMPGPHETIEEKLEETVLTDKRGRAKFDYFC